MWLEFKNRTEQHVALPLAGGAGAGLRTARSRTRWAPLAWQRPTRQTPPSGKLIGAAHLGGSNRILARTQTRTTLKTAHGRSPMTA